MQRRLGLLTETSPLPAIEEQAKVLEFRSPHDKRWDSLGADDAPMVRDALVHADELRQTHSTQEVQIDRGDLYLKRFAIERLAS